MIILSYLVESPDECHNPGPACHCCPLFDTCDSHESEEDDDGC